MYIWRNRNRRDRRQNKLSGLFAWGADKAASSTEVSDDILRQEGEDIHVGYFHDRIRIVMHEYLSTTNGLKEVDKMIDHLNESAHQKAFEEAKNAAEAAGEKFDASKLVVINSAVTKRHNIYEVFRKFDADGGGTLDPDELRVLLDELKIPMTDEELVELFEELDEDGEGGIDFEEFYTWFIREAENQKKKNKLSYFANVVTGGMFDGFAKLVMGVEARNLCMDHAVWTAAKDAKTEYRIAHPPRFLCNKPHCGESFATQDEWFAHRDDIAGHDEKDQERTDLLERFHTVELFLAGPHGRMVSANRLLYSNELAPLQVRIQSVEPQPFRPRMLDTDNKREKQQLRGMLVQGYDPKAGIRAGYRRRGMRSQHLCPGRTAEQKELQDVIAGLLHCRDDSIDVVSAPSTSQHAPCVFTWKGFARKTIELVGNFNGWKREALSPYLQIPAPKEPLTSVEEDMANSRMSENEKKGFEAQKSLTFGRSSIIKNLGPGKYLYRYVIDGVEMLDDQATKAIDPLTGIECNVILVINPMIADNQKRKMATALTRMFPNSNEAKALDAHSLADDMSVGSYFSVLSHDNNSPVVVDLVPPTSFKKKGLYDDVIHVNNLHTTAARIEKERHLEGMSRVNLRNMALYDDGAWAFAAFMQNNSFIQDLDISFNGISDDGMQAVATIIPHLKQLHTFRANGNCFGYDGLRYLVGPLFAKESLRRLELSGNVLADDGAELIATKLLPLNKNLKELYLDENKIGDDGAIQIGEGIIRNKVLETLTLAKNLIYNAGAQRLAFAIQSSGSLKSVRINDCPLGPMGARSFGDMILMNDALTYLDLSSIDMQRNKNGAGLESIITGISKNKVLKHLSIKNAGITDLQAVDLVQALQSNLSLDHLDLDSNKMHAKWFKPDHYFETKISRKTPSIATRMAQIAKIKLDPEAKKYIGKPREMDESSDGKWTWRRKWKKIDRNAEGRRALALSGSEEEVRIQLEKEYCDEQLEKYLVGIAAFLENPNCKIFISTISKLIVQHMYELLALKPEPPPRDLAAEEAARIAAIMQKLEEEREARKKAREQAWQMKAPSKSSVSSGDLDDFDENDNQNDGMSKVKGGRDGDKDTKSVDVGDKTKEIEWDDERFNHAHVAICKSIFIACGADARSLMLPYEKMEHAFQLLAIPIHTQDLQAAVHECQVLNQPFVSFRKFLWYTKTHAKRIVGGNFFARMRVQADLFFRLPEDEAKAIIIDTFRFVAINDIRKNYRLQLESPPLFVCSTCHTRFNSLKSFEKHVAKGDNAMDHKRDDMLAEIDESQRYFLRRAKWLVTNTFFPAFFELSPDKSLPEDYIPQIFDSMGEEGRPIGTVEPDKCLLVEDVLGDFLQVAYEGRLGWVKYQLPHERERFRRVLRPACEEVQYFSWKSLRVHTKPIYVQVRDDKELPKNFELKVRLMPVLSAEAIGYLKMGQIVESRGSVGDWMQCRFENEECCWVVKTVGGGAHRPPLTRLEKKAILKAERAKAAAKAEARKERIRLAKAAMAKRKNKSKQPVVFDFKDEPEPEIPPGAYGADTMRVLHEQVQKRLQKSVVTSPYTPVPEDLEVIDYEAIGDVDDDGTGSQDKASVKGGDINVSVGKASTSEEMKDTNSVAGGSVFSA